MNIHIIATSAFATIAGAHIVAADPTWQPSDFEGAYPWERPLVPPVNDPLRARQACRKQPPIAAQLHIESAAERFNPEQRPQPTPALFCDPEILHASIFGG